MADRKVDYLLIGGGLASANCARWLREEGAEGEVLLVGHESDFSNEVARLTGAKVALKKGGIAVVDGSTLVALWRPKELKRIAR